MKEYPQLGSKDTRSGFGVGLLEAGKRNENVVALCADLIGSVRMDLFQEAFPERMIECGIAEANMIGIAAGLALSGKVAFASSFAAFFNRTCLRSNTSSSSLFKYKCKNSRLTRRNNIRRRRSNTSNLGRHRNDENVTKYGSVESLRP